jgi:HTH-type transcriptional regulator / antitoxin HigA
LKSISSEAELATAQAVLEALLRRDDLERGAEDYLEALSDLIEVYEEAHHSFEPASLPGVLAHLMDARSLSQSDVSREAEIPKSTVSALLNGKRTITIALAGKLGALFHVPPSVFINAGAR